MEGRQKVERAKRRLLAAAGDRDWLQAVGIGLVEQRLGLIVSVQPRTKGAASRILRRLELDVPVKIRGIEEIRARRSPAAAVAGPEDTSESLDSLRAAAGARLGRRRR